MSQESVPKKLYYRIGEVCRRLDLEPHTLRAWEAEIPALKPRKNRAGHRIFTDQDIALIARIKTLIQQDGFTLAGAKKRLSSGDGYLNGGSASAASYDRMELKKAVSEVRQILIEARKLLEPEG